MRLLRSKAATPWMNACSGLRFFSQRVLDALRIVVRQQRMVALAREITGEICRYRRFTRTAFWIQDENSLHVVRSLRSRPHHSKYVIALTAALETPLRLLPMEWVLQVGR